LFLKFSDDHLFLNIQFDNVEIKTYTILKKAWQVNDITI
jgi:hypothetical protein